MRKRMSLLVFALVLVLALPAIAQDATPEATDGALVALEPWTCPEGFEGQTLSVYNWSTYVAEDTIPNFEAACGVTVIYDVYGSNEEMLSRLRTGNPGNDIVVPTDYTLQIMIEEGLMAPIDLAKIPNFRHVAAYLTDTKFDPGNQYSVPYQWGTVGVAYNREAVGEEITTWQQMFNYDGTVAWLEDPRVMINLGFVAQGMPPNPTDASLVPQSRDFLIAHGNNVVAIAADDGQALLERGDADMVIEYSGDIFQLMTTCECDDFAYVIPEEGAPLWVDNLAIPVGGPNPDLAHVFIDYILDPQVSADIANYTQYGSPNQTAVDAGLIDEGATSNPAIYPQGEIADRLYTSEAIPFEVDQAYIDAWDELKIMLGR